MRLLFASRSEKQPAISKASPLPRRLLRRVLERMRADLSETVDLATLAAESGYSRAHFCACSERRQDSRRIAHLLQLRLAEAQARSPAGRGR